MPRKKKEKRIAKDLHYGIGQSLLRIKKQLDSTHNTTMENRQMISETLAEVRSISRDLHPFQLEKFGLTFTISEMLDKLDRSTSIFITKELDNIDGKLSGQMEINICRTVQEALNNIVKHADASAVWVSMKSYKKDIVLTIQNNGKGFGYEMESVNSNSPVLSTLFERISSIGGKLKIEPNSPNGSVIKRVIPLLKK